MLIRRETIEKIGFLDEIYGVGYFEDSDYSRRAAAAGFRCVIAKDAYVGHREHSTFKSEERDGLFQRNRDIFHSRWGAPRRILCVSRFCFPATIDFCFQLARKGNWVWMVLPHQDKNKEAIFRAHTNIKPVFVPLLALGFYPFFITLIKRKKRFDAVYLEGGLFRSLSKVLSLFFKGEIKELNEATTYGTK
jgi:hypothetical protein